MADAPYVGETRAFLPGFDARCTEFNPRVEHGVEFETVPPGYASRCSVEVWESWPLVEAPREGEARS